MVFGDRSIFIKVLFITPECLHPRFFRVMYARYWFWWFKKQSKLHFEMKIKYIKMLCEGDDFLNLKQNR